MWTYVSGDVFHKPAEELQRKTTSCDLFLSIA